MRKGSAACEIWVYKPEKSALSEHCCVAAGIDVRTAMDLTKRLNTLIIISKMPDLRVYIRTKADITYNIRVDDRIVRSRYNKDDAYAAFEMCKRHLATVRRRKFRVSMTAVNNNILRNIRVDRDFLRIHLENDPVYGVNPPPPIVDYPDSYYAALVDKHIGTRKPARTMTYEEAMAIVNRFDKKEIIEKLKALGVWRG